CPKCGTRIKYGTAGVANLVARHLDTPTCDKAWAKRDKQPRKNGLLTDFLVPKSKLLPSTVRAPPPINVDGPSSERTNPVQSAPQPLFTPVVSPSIRSSGINRLLDQLREKIEHLPSTIPITDQTNPLSEFFGDP
ncbi:hypothetical protein DFH07DRAFT_708147, partial [Mycena maculata]